MPAVDTGWAYAGARVSRRDAFSKLSSKRRARRRRKEERKEGRKALSRISLQIIKKNFFLASLIDIILALLFA